MASMNKASRTIFVGNISHEGSDEEIGALMNQIGPTVSMRIMKDRDTGRRKGFAFIEYQDADTAMNALRSLAEYDFHGRPLRVSLAQEENKPTSQRGTPPVSAGAQTRTAFSDPVAAVVNATPSIQLFDLLQRTRDFVAQQPQQAQALLISQPPLCYALSLGLDRLLGNLVDDTETSKLSSAAESTPMEVSSQQMQTQQAQQMQQIQPQPQAPKHPAGDPRLGGGGGDPRLGGGGGGDPRMMQRDAPSPTPQMQQQYGQQQPQMMKQQCGQQQPRMQQQYGQKQPQMQQQYGQQQGWGMHTQQHAQQSSQQWQAPQQVQQLDNSLKEQLLSLGPEQLAQLGPAERAQVEQLKQQVMQEHQEQAQRNMVRQQVLALGPEQLAQLGPTERAQVEQLRREFAA